MNFPHQREQLPDLLCDALDDAARARVEAHLRECPQCARELRQLQQMQATLASLPSAPVPVSVRANVRAALREKPRNTFALPLALPFAFPLNSRQLAWGGAAAIGAIGLMLLARPSLQRDDAFSQPAPLSESEIATRSASDAARDTAPTNAATAPQSRARAAAKPAKTKAPANQPAPAAASSNSPKTTVPAPVLPPPTASAPTDNSAPATPSFVFPAAPQPIAPPKAKTSPSRPVAPADMSAAPPKAQPNPATQSELTRPAATPRAKIARITPPELSAQSTGKVSGKFAPATPSDTTPNAATPSARSAPPAPMMAPAPAADVARAADAARAGSGDRNGSADAPHNGLAPGESPMGARALPAPLARENQASNEPLMQKSNGNATISNWPGGQIKASLATRADRSRTGARTNVQNLAAAAKAPLVLTLSVANPIGNARLILLAPDGELTIWRGALGALPAQIEIARSTLDKLKAAKEQNLRARLEQIDGAGNLTSSSVFEVPLAE